MFKLLKQTRRPDITFCRDGRILITARVSRILSIAQGDSINIAREDGEFLLFAVRHSECIGRHVARCRATKKRSRNLCANSVELCRAILQYAKVNTDRAAFMTGEAITSGGVVYVPIIMSHPL